MPVISYSTTRPWEDNIGASSPNSESLLRSLIIMKDTTIFGICLGFVYAISFLIVMMVTALARLSTSTKEKINDYAPVVLTIPFWGEVFVMSSDYTAGTVLAPLRLPLMEAVFWSMIAWATFISGFAIIATLICLVRLSHHTDYMDGCCASDSARCCDLQMKHAEEATSLTLEEALATTSPTAPPFSPVPPPTSLSPSDDRTRMGSIARCWH